jgi:UDP-glucose 4-epimerase
MVTGGAGFIGSALVDRLLAEGYEVDVVDDLSRGSLANLADARLAGGRALRIHQLDIRLPETTDLIARRRPRVIFHLAAQIDVRVSVDDPVLDADVNVLGTLRVLEGARTAGTDRVVVAASGGTLYGELDPGDLPVRESHPYRPLSPYGVSKKATIDYLVVYRELHALEFCALALGNVYGPRQNSLGEAGVVAIFAEALVAGRPVTVFGDGKQTRDYVYVDDVVDAFARAATRGGGLVCNVGTGMETSVNELLGTMAATAGVVPEVRHAPQRAGELRRSALDPTRASIHLGWRPWTSLGEGTAAVVAEARRARAGRVSGTGPGSGRARPRLGPSPRAATPPARREPPRPGHCEPSP